MDYSDIEQHIKIFGTKKLKKGHRDTICCLIECCGCHENFYKDPQDIRKALKKTNKIHCSSKCFYAKKRRLVVSCKECSKEFLKSQSQIRSSPNNFCSQSCAATFNNKNKSHGNRRSKIEQLTEDMIKNDYPTLSFECNQKKHIGSELDFYFPSLKLALEFNGPLHYFATYGEDKLNKIQSMDYVKQVSCKRNNIKLIIINVSNDTYLNENLKLERLNQVRAILDNEIIEQDLKYYR